MIEMSQIVYVRLPEQQVKELDKLVQEKLHTSRSDIIQQAVSEWLFERGYIHTKKKTSEEVPSC